MMEHRVLAENYFKQGYNCSQSVAAAFAPDMGLELSDVLKMTAGFGGGFGRMREVCGAFSGIVFVLGTMYGSDDPAGKTALYTTVQALAEKYKEKNGANSIICRELLGLDKAEGSPVASPRTSEYYKKRPCNELVGLAAEIMEEYIAEHPLPGREPTTNE